MYVINLRLFNVLNLHLGQVKVICSVCGKLATRKIQTIRKRERDASDLCLSSPREAKEGCREQGVLRGMLEMDNHRRLRRKDEAFKSSIDEARAAQIGDLLSARLV